MIIIKNNHLNAIREAIQNYSGIILERLQKSRVEKIIISQMEQLNNPNIDSYIELLKDSNNTRIMDDLIGSATVGESYMFRNPKQFDYMIDCFFPEFFQKNKANFPMRIWSAGCSRGEEAYSIAMVARDYQVKHPEAKFTINAGDISKKNLQIAKSGIYGNNSLRGKKEYFEGKLGFKMGCSNDNGDFAVSEEIKQMVYFQWLNLKDINKLKIMHGSDIIFCRNVLIYFDEALRKKLLEIFFECLNPGGILFIGESECFPFPANTFVAQNNQGSYAYKKPDKQ